MSKFFARRKRRKRRRKTWTLVRYRGDRNVYASCDCGFEYNCCFDISRGEPSKGNEPDLMFNYCPNCGQKKIFFISKIHEYNVIMFNGRSSTNV